MTVDFVFAKPSTLRRLIDFLLLVVQHARVFLRTCALNGAAQKGADSYDFDARPWKPPYYSKWFRFFDCFFNGFGSFFSRQTILSRRNSICRFFLPLLLLLRLKIPAKLPLWCFSFWCGVHLTSRSATETMASAETKSAAEHTAPLPFGRKAQMATQSECESNHRNKKSEHWKWNRCHKITIKSSAQQSQQLIVADSFACILTACASGMLISPR